jgi:membrane protein implicated in regulation of membrane protease activity
MHHPLLYILLLLAFSLFLFLPFSQALLLFVPVLVLSLIFCGLAWKDRRRPVKLGVAGMIGDTARVMEDATGQLKVSYRGEIWDAICSTPVTQDETVQITGVEQMKLLVKKR